MDLYIILIGLIVSIIFYEVTSISPGGIITTGVLLLFIDTPERIIYTVLIGIFSYLIVRLLSKFLIIYGKREYVILIFTSIFLNFLMQIILEITSFNLINISMIDFLIPGVIAYTLTKQGLKKTLPSMVITFGIAELIILIGESL